MAIRVPNLFFLLACCLTPDSVAYADFESFVGGLARDATAGELRLYTKSSPHPHQAQTSDPRFVNIVLSSTVNFPPDSHATALAGTVPFMPAKEEAHGGDLQDKRKVILHFGSRPPVTE